MQWMQAMKLLAVLEGSTDAGVDVVDGGNGVDAGVGLEWMQIYFWSPLSTSIHFCPLFGNFCPFSPTFATFPPIVTHFCPFMTTFAHFLTTKARKTKRKWCVVSGQSGPKFSLSVAKSSQQLANKYTEYQSAYTS